MSESFFVKHFSSPEMTQETRQEMSERNDKRRRSRSTSGNIVFPARPGTFLSFFFFPFTFLREAIFFPPLSTGPHWASNEGLWDLRLQLV